MGSEGYSKQRLGVESVSFLKYGRKQLTQSNNFKLLLLFVQNRL